MAKWGMCDFSELEKLEKEFEKLAKTDVEKFCKDVAKELAARLLSKVIPRTPVGEGTFEVINEKKYTIKSGGTLRRGWTANTEAEAESGSVPDPTTYADSLKIFKFGIQLNMHPMLNMDIDKNLADMFLRWAND